MARQSASGGGIVPHSARRSLHIFCDSATRPSTTSWPRRTVFANSPLDPADNDLAAKLIDVATFDLERNEPQFSARTVISDGQAKALYAMLGATFVFMLGAPALGTMILTGIVAAGYLANAIFRGWLFWVAADRQPERSPLVASPAREAEPPLYSIIVPLYREANVVSQLAEALAALDYPAPRLDVILVVEEDDGETCAAAHRAGLARNFKVLRVPRGEPRTKPRACNYALRFCRGEFLVVYDAEDRPESDQLRKALRSFRSSPMDVACLQARLNFFNARENWLTRGIMAETPEARREPGTSGIIRDLAGNAVTVALVGRLSVLRAALGRLRLRRWHQNDLRLLLFGGGNGRREGLCQFMHIGIDLPRNGVHLVG